MKKWTFLFIFCLLLSFQTLPINRIDNVADGLNIEGGSLAVKELTPEQLWANIAFVLDRPFVDGKELLQITTNNIYELKEMSLEDYNETQVNYTLTTIFKYYLKNNHKLLNKPQSAQTHFMVQIHRNSSGKKYIQHLLNVFTSCLKNSYITVPSAINQEVLRLYFKDYNTVVSFCYGTNYKIFSEQNFYKNINFILSISMISGFRKEWSASEFVIPQEFIPYSLEKNIIYPELKYSAKNNLKFDLQAIIETQDLNDLKTINENFRSINPLKISLKAKPLCLNNFKLGKLVQVEKNFNPSELPKFIQLNSFL